MRKNKIFKVDTTKFKAMELKDNPEFYSRDTDAYLTFTVPDESFEFDKALLYLINIDDGSVITEIETEILGQANVEYEITPEIMAHYGRWRGQIVFEKDGEKASSAIFEFIIKRFLTDERPPTLNEVESIAKLRREAKELIEVLEGMTYDNDSLVDVLQAKDGELTLDARIRRDVKNLENKKADKAEVFAQLAQKADQAFVDSQLASIVSGAPKGTYTDLASLQSAYPSGAEGIFLVLSDGHWYYWQATTSMWEDGGLYQSSGIANGSITREKIAVDAIGQDKIDAKITASPNVLDPSSLTAGQYMYGNIGAEVTQRSSANWSGKLQAIPVKAGDIVRFNLAYQGTYFVGVNDQNIVLQIGAVRATAGDREIIVETGVTKFYTTVFNQYLSEAMITINEPMPEVYTPFGTGDKKKLQWLEVDENNLSVALQDKINSPSTGGGSTSNWTGASMVTAGDSITWQDGRAYAGTTDIARGWQTIVKEKLGLNSVKNIAVSGRPMADGSANGVGSVTTILGLSDITEDLFVIASGTNDFKLNVNIGTLQPIGSTFDRNTYYGAYQTSIEHVINLNPSIKLILFTPLHRNNGGYNSTGFVNTAGHTLDDYRQAIFKLGELYSLPVIDMFAESGINLLTLSVDTRDGLHPNDNGYLKMGLKASAGINNA